MKLTSIIHIIQVFIFICAIIFSITSVNATPVNDNVVLNMTFLHDSGSTVVDDGPYHLNGTIVNSGITRYQLQSGIYARSFTGTDLGYISVPDNDVLSFTNNKFTIEYWVKFNTTSSAQAILGKGASAYEYCIADTTSNDSSIMSYYAFNDTNKELYSHTYQGYDSRGWNQFVYTSDGNTAKVYCDGVLVTQQSTSLSGSMINTNAPLWIGKDAIHYTFLTNASLAMVRMYNTDLSDAQIKQNFDDYVAYLPSGNSPGYALTFDDDYTDHWYNYRNNFKNYNCNATFYVVDKYHYADGTINSTSAGKYLQLQSDGHSIGSHTYNHTIATTYLATHTFDEYINTEIIPDLRVMWEYGLNCVDFSYPGGQSTTVTNQYLPSYFSTVRLESGYNTNGDIIPGANGFRDFNSTNRLCYGFEIDNSANSNVTDDKILRGMEYARLNGVVMILYAHDIYNGTNNAVPLNVSTDRLDTILSTAKNEGVKSYTMHELVPVPVVTFDSVSNQYHKTDGDVNVDLNRSSEYNRTIVLNYNAIDGTAKENSQYTILNNSQLLLPTQNATINLHIINDDAYSDIEKTFSVMYNSASNCLISLGTTDISILDTTVNFSMTPLNGITPLRVMFTDTSCVNQTSQRWDINGDGIVDYTTKSASNTYYNAGTYTVNLTVQNANGNFSVTKTITVSNPTFWSNAVAKANYISTWIHNIFVMGVIAK